MSSFALCSNIKKVYNRQERFEVGKQQAALLLRETKFIVLLHLYCNGVGVHAQGVNETAQSPWSLTSKLERRA